MQIHIDNASERPVYLQIIDAVKREIALRRLSAGDKLPTVRQLASHLVINPNTIAKAYRMMEQQGIITTKPGSGAYVAELQSSVNEDVKKKIVEDQMERVVIDAIHLQIPKEPLLNQFQQVAEKFHFPSQKESGNE